MPQKWGKNNTHVPSRFTAVEDQRGPYHGAIRTFIYIYTQSGAGAGRPRRDTDPFAVDVRGTSRWVRAFRRPRPRPGGAGGGRLAHKPQNPGSSPPIDARAELPRTWTTVDARTIRGRGMSSCRSLRGSAGRARRCRWWPTRVTRVERPSALEPRGRSNDHELSFSSSDGGRARRPSSATMTREPTRIRTDRARRRGSRVRPVRTPGPEIRGH